MAAKCEEESEYWQQSPRIVDFLHLSGNESVKLQEQVFRSNGQVHILVHPFAGEENFGTVFPLDQEYLLRRDQLIRSSLNEAKPLIILEEITTLSQLYSRVEGYGKGLLYVVATDQDYPAPCLSSDSSENPRDVLIESLKKAGVTHSIVGGRYMVLHHVTKATDENGDNAGSLRELKQLAHDKPHALEWLSQNIVPQLCPGLVARWLLTFCDVSLSPVSSPHRLS